MSSLVIILCGVVGCGGSGTSGVGSKGGGTTSGPAISSISPNTVAPGGPGFLLTVAGSGFVTGSVIEWNSTPITTTYISATGVQAMVPAILIATQGSASITVVNPAPNAAISNAETISIAPLPPSVPPTVTSITPNTAVAGGSGFQMTMMGTGFVSGAVVDWGNYSLPATFVSSTELQVQVPASAYNAPATISVGATNPGSNPVESNVLPFTITGLPAPTVTSISPTTEPAGGPSFLLTVNGTNFVQGATVSWGGFSLNATFVSSTELQAQVPASDIAYPETVSVGVSGVSYNAASNTLPFVVTVPPVSVTGAATVATVNIAADDMVWDPVHQLIYLTVLSTDPNYGNSVVALNPSTAQVSASQFAGSNPDKIAVSSDGSYLYAGIDGANAIQRFTLPALGTDINIPLGADSFLGAYFALDLQAAPGLPHTIAVSLGNSGVSPSAEGGVKIYDDTTARPTAAGGFGAGGGGLYDSIQWNSAATQIYAENNEDTGFDLYVLSVNSSGVQQTQDYSGVFTSFGAHLHYDATTGYVYSDDGQAVNPATGAPVGTYNQGSSMGYFVQPFMVPDGTLGYAYFVYQNTSSSSNAAVYTIEAYNLTHFTAAGSITLNNVVGTPVKIIRWGTNGLAILTQNENGSQYPGAAVYLLSGSFVTNP